MIRSYTWGPGIVYEDELGRRTERKDYFGGTLASTNDFSYNIRSEVIEAIMGSDSYNYQYDPIGNRIASDEPQFGPRDYIGRRISKTVRAGLVSAPEIAHSQYLYDGWNLISETIDNQTSTITNHYIWGLDLSQSLQGVGGVGGLLMAVLDGDAYYPGFDANGNVTDYTSASGTTVAEYQYSPFGGITSQTGPMAADFVYRFSTKYHDDETGLVYYGYRYYNPDLGRWINRDPIGEEGGINLYQAMFNNPQFYIDPLGLRSVSSLHEAIDRFGEKALRASEEDFERQLEEYDALPPAERVGRNRPGHPVEFCGRVCEGCNDGENYYYHTGPVAGGVRWCQPQFSPPCNEGDRQVGTYHSHPRDGSGLSPGDRSIADRGVLPPEHPNHIPPGLPIGATWEDSRGRVTDIYTPGRGTRRMRDGSYAQF